MYEKFGQFINGKWQQSSDKGTYDVINPANEEIIGKASKANNKDIHLAFAACIYNFNVGPPFDSRQALFFFYFPSHAFICTR